MKKNGKALVLGGTGAMGVYLAPELAAAGCQVQVVSLDDATSDDPRITHLKANALDDDVLRELLKEQFDIIVDFMIYSTEAFRKRHELLLDNTDRYIFLSTYRVYSGGTPVTEETPRLLDVSEDRDFLSTEDYSLYKARQEDILQQSKYDNWTIIRPSITYSRFRFQLVTLEAPMVVARAARGLPVALPQEALTVPATMTWAGDVGTMIARLIFNPAARRECYTPATAEHRTWGEIAEYYRELIGLRYVPVPAEAYLKIMGGTAGARYQLAYDRLFPRIVDNTKVLRATGLKQSDLMPLREGLARELRALPAAYRWPDPGPVWQRMDDYLKGMPHGQN